MKKHLLFMAGALMASATLKAQIAPAGMKVYDQVPAEASANPAENTIQIHFETAKFELDSLKKLTLDSIYNKLVASDVVHYYTITFTGHADSVGSDSFNLALSQKRAESVYNYFMQKGGGNGITKTALVSYSEPCQGVRYVGKEFVVKMTTDWKGEKEPITSNATDSGRWANRRTTIYLKDDRSAYNITRQKCMVPETDKNFDGAQHTHVYVPAGSIMTLDTVPFACNSNADVQISEAFSMDEVVKSAPLISEKGKAVLYLGKVDLSTTPSYKVTDCKTNPPAGGSTFTVEVPVSQKMLDQEVHVYYFELDSTGKQTLKRAQAKPSTKTNGELSEEFTINPWNTGTIFLGKELDPAKRIKRYAYRVKKDKGQPASTVKGKKYSFAKVKGEKMKYKKRLRKLF